MSEAELQAQCDNLLRRYGILFDHKEKGRGIHKAHSKGRPDLYIFHAGKTIFVELKYGNGKTTPEQEEFGWRAINKGFNFYTAYSFLEFANILVEENILTKAQVVNYI